MIETCVPLEGGFDYHLVDALVDANSAVADAAARAIWKRGRCEYAVKSMRDEIRKRGVKSHGLCANNAKRALQTLADRAPNARAKMNFGAMAVNVLLREVPDGGSAAANPLADDPILRPFATLVEGKAQPLRLEPSGLFCDLCNSELTAGQMYAVSARNDVPKAPSDVSRLYCRECAQSHFFQKLRNDPRLIRQSHEMAVAHLKMQGRLGD